MEVATRNLVQTVSVLRPEADPPAMRPHSCWSDFDNEGFIDRDGELVSRAVRQGFPAIETDESGSATIVWPCCRADEPRGAVVFTCCAGEGVAGAFEIWRRNERGELGLGSSWYANLERLEQVSRYIKFPRRAGLPGRVWEDRFPRVLGSLASSKEFVRVAVARSERLNAAVGVPFIRNSPSLDAVLLLLSTGATPIARAMEVWSRDPKRNDLRIVSADYGQLVDLAPVSRRATLQVGEGIAGRVYQDEAPWLTRDLLGVEFPRGERFDFYGFRYGMGIPIFVGGDLVSCINLYS